MNQYQNFNRPSVVFYLLFIACFAFDDQCLYAQTIDAKSYHSIVAALQNQVERHPSAFPLEALSGGTQSVQEGLKFPYFGYGERRYPSRTDFHPAMDLAYEPLQRGYVKDETGDKIRVRAPQTYLKKVYAIQKGVFVSIQLQQSGYKIILKHKLDRPYLDQNGKPYTEYYTCYRHLDSRSLAFLTGIAKQTTGKHNATYTDLFGRHVFDAGEQIAFVGFNPSIQSEVPRVHLDFSLNLFGDPNIGSSIRKHALNPLLLFPPFAYGDSQSHIIENDGIPAYQFVIDREGLVTPNKTTDGNFQIQIHAGGVSTDGHYTPVRYFALNAIQIIVFNDGKKLCSDTINRSLKHGYDTSSFDLLDLADESKPHFNPPLGEQQDVLRMNAVLPTQWLTDMGYNWSVEGSVNVTVSSIWHGSLDGHHHSFTISIPAALD